MIVKRRRERYLIRFALIGAIQVGFIVAKLTGVLAWHWALILSPTLACIGIFAAVFIVAVLIVTITE